MKIKITSIDGKTGETKKVAELWTDESGMVQCSDQDLLGKIREEPPRNVLQKKFDQFVTPEDGELFLKNLPLHFRNVYFMATEVDDADTSKR